MSACFGLHIGYQFPPSRDGLLAEEHARADVWGHEKGASAPLDQRTLRASTSTSSRLGMRICPAFGALFMFVRSAGGDADTSMSTSCPAANVPGSIGHAGTVIDLSPATTSS